MRSGAVPMVGSWQAWNEDFIAIYGDYVIWGCFGEALASISCRYLRWLRPLGLFLGGFEINILSLFTVVTPAGAVSWRLGNQYFVAICGGYAL